MTIDERTAIAEEATRLEAAGADWHAKHVAAVLGCSRSTVYDTAWLLKIKRGVGRTRARWNPAEVRTAQREEADRRNRTHVPRTRRRTA